MPEKFGSDQIQLGNTGGAVQSQDNAVLISGDSAGETALLFGPASLREIQTGVANGDMSIPPSDPTANITTDNPMPYWTISTTGSTCSAIFVADALQGSGNAVRVTVGAGTSGSLTLTRYIPLPGTRAQTFSVQPVITLGGASNNIDAEFYASGQQFDSTLTSIAGTTVTLNTLQFNSFTGTVKKLLPDSDQLSTWKNAAVASNAAFYKITLVFQNSGTTAANRTIDLYDVRLLMGSTDLTVAETTTPATYGPSWIRQTNGTLRIQADVVDASTKSIYLNSTGAVVPTSLYFSNTGSTSAPRIALGGTNNQLWAVSSPAADLAASTTGAVSGVLITKSVAGQPTTNVNGTGTTDAFADALRNGGMASDNTNGRFYVYNGSAWKYAALTTPSDSRLKEEIKSITGALDTLRQLVPVAFKWKRPEAHPRTDAVADDGQRLGFLADQVATTDLKHWVEDMGVGEIEHDLVEDTSGRVLAVNIPQNEMEALVVQALLDIDARLKALES
jgi:hypothetical protein